MTAGRILNIPNILTLARIALIPVFLGVAYWPPAMGAESHASGISRHMLLTGIFVVAAVTDWFDGYLARTLNQTSAFGRFLDPVADKLMVAAALIVLVQWQPSISMAFAAIVIISREITVSALREWMAELGARTSVAVSTVGKYKTAFQMIAISVFLLNWQPLEMLGYALL
ncbi:MAG: CDP-diacylglycerol--glycerol-3-phosphate 3-phosphatidyltransferase, partial [Acinetobacter sp.]|nr:CDP-diacylglycerol--glycerol-3-phosphate 3-phosphatidyltransferase [Acinetobacter sp.]